MARKAFQDALIYYDKTEDTFGIRIKHWFAVSLDSPITTYKKSVFTLINSSLEDVLILRLQVYIITAKPKA